MLKSEFHLFKDLTMNFFVEDYLLFFINKIAH